MQEYIRKRCQDIGIYIAETGATVRQAAQKFGLSKSSVHKDATVQLLRVNPALYEQVRVVLEKNKLERHLRGGIATKAKYAAKRGG